MFRLPENWQAFDQGRQKRRLNSSNVKTNIIHCLICLFMEPIASWVKGYTSTHLIMCMENRLTKAGADIFHMANAKKIRSADDGSVAREAHQYFNMGTLSTCMRIVPSLWLQNCSSAELGPRLAVLLCTWAWPYEYSAYQQETANSGIHNVTLNGASY